MWSVQDAEEKLRLCESWLQPALLPKGRWTKSNHTVQLKLYNYSYYDCWFCWKAQNVAVFQRKDCNILVFQHMYCKKIKSAKNLNWENNPFGFVMNLLCVKFRSTWTPREAAMFHHQSPWSTPWCPWSSLLSKDTHTLSSHSGNQLYPPLSDEHADTISPTVPPVISWTLPHVTDSTSPSCYFTAGFVIWHLSTALELALAGVSTFQRCPFIIKLIQTHRESSVSSQLVWSHKFRTHSSRVDWKACLENKQRIVSWDLQWLCCKPRNVCKE